MERRANEHLEAKQAWKTPELTVYGSVEQITQQFKYKSFGAGDDVLVDLLPILS
jgi:hypothetical protein